MGLTYLCSYRNAAAHTTISETAFSPLHDLTWRFQLDFISLTLLVIEYFLANGSSKYGQPSPVGTLCFDQFLSCAQVQRGSSAAIRHFLRRARQSRECGLFWLLELFAPPPAEYMYPLLLIVPQSSGSERLRLFKLPKMHLQTLMCFSAIALTAMAAPTSTSHVVHEKRQSEPLNWQKYSRVDPSIVLPVRIGLTQSNLENGPALLDEV